MRTFTLGLASEKRSNAGAAILYVSSELEEVLAVSDRIAVMSGRSFVAIVDRAEADLRQIGLWMAGRAA